MKRTVLLGMVPVAVIGACLLSVRPASARSMTITTGSGMNLSDGMSSRFEGKGSITPDAGDTAESVILKLDGGLLPEGSNAISSTWDWQADSQQNSQYSGIHKLGARATVKDAGGTRRTVDVPESGEIEVIF